MTDTNIAKLQSARLILERIESQDRARRAYIQGARRAAIIGRLLPLSVAYGAGFLSAQILYFILF